VFGSALKNNDQNELTDAECDSREFLMTCSNSPGETEKEMNTKLYLSLFLFYSSICQKTAKLMEKKHEADKYEKEKKGETGRTAKNTLGFK
jgi:hypothetical protein